MAQEKAKSIQKTEPKNFAVSAFPNKTFRPFTIGNHGFNELEKAFDQTPNNYNRADSIFDNDLGFLTPSNAKPYDSGSASGTKDQSGKKFVRPQNNRSLAKAPLRIPQRPPTAGSVALASNKGSLSFPAYSASKHTDKQAPLPKVVVNSDEHVTKND